MLLDPLRLLDGLYTNIGCKVVEVVEQGNVSIWVDEEGLLKPSPTPFWVGEGGYVGNAIFLGLIDDDGEVTDIQITIQEMAERIHPTPEVVE